MKKEKDKKVSGFNILLLLLIALFIFGLICFTNFAYQASVSDDDYQDNNLSYSETTE